MSANLKGESGGKVRLGDLCTLVRGASPRPKGDPRYFGGNIPWVSISDVTRTEGKYLYRTSEFVTPAGASLSRLLEANTLIVSNSATICVPKILATQACIHDGFVALTHLSPRVDKYYLFHFFDCIRPYMRAKHKQGATQVNLNTDIFKALEIPLPTLSEQRRIAAILDQAEALRAKRRAALAKLDSLTQSIFLDMFGDPDRNPNAWPVVCFQDILGEPMRNGVSPATDGTVEAEVLTLSAITWNEFDSSHSKRASFRSIPPSNQRVDSADFLICRGNGNLKQVGRGVFPSESRPDLVFPDTMIAARVDSNQIKREYLQQIWMLPMVRNQIESLARTTNGTYKVNQEILAGIRIWLPPIHLQEGFSRTRKMVRRSITTARQALDDSSKLLSSLQAQLFEAPSEKMAQTLMA